MPRGLQLAPLTLTDEERDILQRWLRRRKTAQALVQRAQLVLAAAPTAGRTRTWPGCCG